MSDVERVLELHELDELLVQLRLEAQAPRWRRLGYAVGSAVVLERERERLAAAVERRWLGLYERSRRRYGHGLSGVRERVCLGCHVTLPTSAAPPPGEAQLQLCQGCGRLLLWS